MKIQSGRETPPEAQTETVWTCCLESSPAKRSHQGEPQATTPQLMSPSLSPKIFYTKITQSFVRPTKKERQRRKKKLSGDRQTSATCLGWSRRFDRLDRAAVVLNGQRQVSITYTDQEVPSSTNRVIIMQCVISFPVCLFQIKIKPKTLQTRFLHAIGCKLISKYCPLQLCTQPHTKGTDSDRILVLGCGVRYLAIESLWYHFMLEED